MEGLRFFETWIRKSSDLLVAALSLLILIVLMRFSRRKTIFRTEKEVPQVPGLPIIGNLHQLSRLPHLSLLELARRYGPFLSLRLGSLRTLVVSNAEIAKEILKTQDAVWASRPPVLLGEIFFYNYSNVILQPANEVWRNMRKLYISELLSPSNVAKQKDQRNESVLRAVNNILASQHGNRSFDILATLADMNYYQMTRLIFGKKAQAEDNWRSTGENKTLLQLVRELESIDLFSLGEFFPSLRWLDIDPVETKLRKIHLEFDNYLNKRLEARRRQILEANDEIEECRDFSLVLLSLLDSSDESLLNLKNLKAALLDMVLGGSETSVSTAGYAIAEIMRHPEIKETLLKELDDVVGRQRLVEESDLINLKYMKLVIKETLRLHPALPLLVPHMSTAPSVVAGYRIPANSQLLINAYAIHRDPEVWEDPFAFKPERFSDSSIDVRGQHFQLLPFGAGRRICPGITMGLAFLELALAQLFHTLDIELPPGLKPEDVDMTDRSGVAATLANPLHVVVKPRLSHELYRK